MRHYKGADLRHNPCSTCKALNPLHHPRPNQSTSTRDFRTATRWHPDASPQPGDAPRPVAPSLGDPPHSRLQARRSCRLDVNPAFSAARDTLAPCSSDSRAISRRIARR